MAIQCRSTRKFTSPKFAIPETRNPEESLKTLDPLTSSLRQLKIRASQTREHRVPKPGLELSAGTGESQNAESPVDRSARVPKKSEPSASNSIHNISRRSAHFPRAARDAGPQQNNTSDEQKRQKVCEENLLSKERAGPGGYERPLSDRASRCREAARAKIVLTDSKNSSVPGQRGGRLHPFFILHHSYPAGPSRPQELQNPRLVPA